MWGSQRLSEDARSRLDFSIVGFCPVVTNFRSRILPKLMASYPEGFRAPEILAAGKLETAPHEKGMQYESESRSSEEHEPWRKFPVNVEQFWLGLDLAVVYLKNYSLDKANWGLANLKTSQDSSRLKIWSYCQHMPAICQHSLKPSNCRADRAGQIRIACNCVASSSISSSTSTSWQQ